MSPRAGDRIAHAALRADLIVAAQPDRAQERPDQHDVQKDLIIETGRPVLLVPPGHGNAPIGIRILLAWNATRGAAAGAHGQLPILAGAEEAVVLTVSSERSRTTELSTEGHELSLILARHGVNVTVRHVDQTKPSVGAQIQHEPNSNGCDLVIMGGFGHPRLHSLFFWRCDPLHAFRVQSTNNQLKLKSSFELDQEGYLLSFTALPFR